MEIGPIWTYRTRRPVCKLQVFTASSLWSLMHKHYFLNIVRKETEMKQMNIILHITSNKMSQI